MASRFSLLSFLFCFSFQCLAAHGRSPFSPYEEIFVSLGDGRTISLSTLRAGPNNGNKWVIAIPGMTNMFHDARALLEKPEFRSFLNAGFNIAYMNKTGVFGDNFDHQMFDQSSRANLRLQDSLMALRHGFPADSEFFLVTHSESSYLAPEMALVEPRIKAIVMKSGGTRPWLTEELAKMSKPERKDGAQMVARIRNGEVPDFVIWKGYPVGILRSYDVIQPKQALSRLKIPVLAIIAADDDLIDVKGALRDLEDVASKKGSRLSRAILLQGGHRLIDRDWVVARHTFSFILKAANGLPATIPAGLKSCTFIFDHKLLLFQ